MTSALHIDTLKFSRKLTAAGMEPAAAEAIAETLAEVEMGDVATKADIQRLAADSDALAVKTRAEIEALRSDVRADISALRADMRDLENRLVIKTGGMIVGALAILTALMRLIPAG